MAIDYKKVGWDTSKFVNPSNLNKMDDGIKAACDGVDALNENIATKNLKTYTSLAQIGCTSANTISEIMAKLPSNAVLDIGVSTTENNLTNSLPVVAAGRLVATKQYSTRGIAIFTRFSNGTTWINPYMDSKFVGWNSIALNSDLAQVGKTEKQLYIGTTDVSLDETMTLTLNEDINNYRDVVFMVQVNNKFVVKTIPVVILLKSSPSIREYFTINDNYRGFMDITYVNGTTINFKLNYNGNFTALNIHGVK